MKIAILDDYQNVAAQCADWSPLAHIGYVADDLYRTFYQDTVSWMEKRSGTDPR